MSTTVKILIAFALFVGVVMVVVVGVSVYFLLQSPDTFAYPGHQMKKSHLATVRDLGLLEDGETIQFFYSDAFLDIRDKMYFITDKRLVLYSEDWAQTTLSVPYDQIVDAEVMYDDSFFVDSTITVTLDNGEEWSFPVSSERGHDEDFFAYIDERIARDSDLEEPAV